MAYSLDKRLTKLLVYGWLIFRVIEPLQAQTLLTLEEAVQTVLKNNFDIQIARNKQQIATQNHHIGNTGFLPRLDTHLSGNGDQQTSNIPLSTGFSLNWNIFNGMHSLFSYQHLGRLRQISQLHTQEVMDQKVAEVAKSYYSLALNQKKKCLLESCLAIAQEVLQLTQAKYKVGECTKLDYLTAQVQYNENQANLLLQEEAMAEAKLTFRNLLGKNAPEDFIIVEDIPLPSELTWEALSQALKTTNTSLLTAQKSCEDAALAIKMQKAKLWPQVDFSLGYALGSQHLDHGWKATPTGFHYGVAVSFNLFNAFQHYTAIQEAKVKADNANLSLEAQQMQLEARLKQFFLHYTQQLQRHTLIQQHVQVSQENEALALEQYRLGKITLLELDKARKNAQEAALKCWQAIYDAKITEVALQRLCSRVI